MTAGEKSAHAQQFVAALRQALAGRALPTAAWARFAGHYAALCAWNQRVNLTTIVEPQAAALHHFADSLAVLPHLPDGAVVDFGSGGGFPGLVLAAARPQDVPMVLVEPRRKRASFLQMTAARLGLAQVRVVCGRLEDTPPQRFAAAVTRATFGSWAFLADVQPWLVPGGKLFCWRSSDAPRPATTHRALPYVVGERPRLLIECQFP